MTKLKHITTESKGTLKRLPPLKAIRKRCLDCSGYERKEVKDCWDTNCPLYPFRMGTGIKGESRMKAIRKFCLSCSGNSSHEAKLCPVTDCPLYEYRFGKNPSLVGKRGKKNSFLPKIGR